MSNSKRTQCTNKMRHTSLAAATTAMNRTIRHLNKPGKDPIMTRLNAYKCEHCGGYHVGRKKSRGIMWNLVEARDRELAELRKKTSK